MKYILSIAFLITLISACAGSYTPGNSGLSCYDCRWIFVVDEKFSTPQKEQIQLALAEWQQHIPEITYNIYYEQLFEKYDIQQRLVHIHCGYPEDMTKAGSLGNTLWYGDQFSGAEIYINITPDLVQNDNDLLLTRRVVEHELGHAFLLSHVSEAEREDIMNPIANINGPITNEDVNKFYELHPLCITNITNHTSVIDGGD